MNVRSISHVHQAAKSIAILMTWAAFQSSQSTRCWAGEVGAHVFSLCNAEVVTSSHRQHIDFQYRELHAKQLCNCIYVDGYAVWPCVQQRHTTVEQQDIT